ncbi:MAG: GDSL-type esterase/lipase family protein [Chloroflexota bacterium]
MGSRFVPPLAAFLFLSLSLSPILTPLAHAQASAPLYLALGDSLAFGVGAGSPADQGYVGLTTAVLRASERFSESGLDLENLSAPAATTADLLEPEGQLARGLTEILRRAADGDPGNDVKLISLSIGANDLLALAEPDAPCVQNAGSETCRNLLTQTLADVQSNITEVLGQLREAAPDAEIYVMNLYNPYSGSGEEFELIASVGVQQLNGVIGVAAAIEEFDARLAPVFELFQGRAEQWIAQDGIHPNDDGYRVMAEALQAAIEGRPVSIPEDLLALPSDAPPANQVTASGDGVDTIVVLLALPAAFIAGAFLSSAYFLMRGRA